MNITEVRVKLMRSRSDRLRAFCSITIDDDFVVHDLRVIQGRKGFFVAMPSRKLADNCPDCGAKNELKAKFCNNCGHKLDESRASAGSNARDKFHVDVAHPINTPCRESIQKIVLAAYKEEAAGSEHELSGVEELPVEDLGELGELEDLEEMVDLPEPEQQEQAEQFDGFPTESEGPFLAETLPESQPEAEPPFSWMEEPQQEQPEEEEEDEDDDEETEVSGFGAGIF
ncbi:MAG: septation protein SpoVG family protein [Planctomycetes bacterium]|nr:septation protein SpoVG family protein [Planctomycetota bacterium]